MNLIQLNDDVQKIKEILKTEGKWEDSTSTTTDSTSTTTPVHMPIPPQRHVVVPSASTDSTGASQSPTAAPAAAQAVTATKSINGKRSYGYRADLPDFRDLTYKAPTLTLPSLVDLRSTCSPVLDQGDLGSCTSFACTGALEFLEDKDKLPFVPMSQLFVYYNERMVENTTSYDSGAELRDGIKAMAKYGCCAESEWPYNISRFTIKPSAKCYTDGLKHTISSYYRISTLSDMKSCLASGFPFVFGITCYDSFESDNATATGIIPMPSSTESVLGGHALLCVGYDNTKDWFIFKNSWGTSWGDKGYGFIPFAYLTNANLASDFWYVSKGKNL